jgi:hypothetical protein
MNKHSRKTSTTGLFLAAVSASLTLPFSLQAVPADHKLYECNLSGGASAKTDLNGCSNDTGNGYLTSLLPLRTAGSAECLGGTDYCAAAADTTQAPRPIDAFGVCRYVDNSNPGTPVFVPFSKTNEWSAFLNNLPGGVTTKNCIPPYSTGTAMISGPYAGCDSFSIAAPNVHYGRPNDSYWPSTPMSHWPSVYGAGVYGPNTTCRGSTLVVRSMIQWNTTGASGTAWTATSGTRAMKYGPDINLTSPAVVSFNGGGTGQGSTTLTWDIAPYIGGTGGSCTVAATNGAWGTAPQNPVGAGITKSGTTTATIRSGTNTFQLNCTTAATADAPALVSVATINVTGTDTYTPPPPCCFGG